jgi:DNA-binding transcriptional MerR regulator
MSEHFRINEFSHRVGVTVKALRHYDRVGLLSPRRTEAGHRVYSLRDVTRVREITALKRLGLPLRRIKTLLEPSGPPLPAILEQQRDVLGEQHRLIGIAIQALARAERALRAAPRDDSLILQRLVEDLEMSDNIDAMRRYYSDDVWSEWRSHYEHWPSEAWRALYQDINAALDSDPCLPADDVRAQAFATRWMALDASDTSIPAVRTGLRRAWADRERWPEALRNQLTALNVERAAHFVSAALWERWDAERVAREQAGQPAARVSEARHVLFRDGAAALGLSPNTPEVRLLAERWAAILEEESGGHEDIKAELVAGFRSRVRWPPGLIRTVAASYQLDSETWTRVANLVETAHDENVGPIDLGASEDAPRRKQEGPAEAGPHEDMGRLKAAPTTVTTWRRSAS